MAAQPVATGCFAGAVGSVYLLAFAECAPLGQVVAVLALDAPAAGQGRGVWIGGGSGGAHGKAGAAGPAAGASHRRPAHVSGLRAEHVAHGEAGPVLQALRLRFKAVAPAGAPSTGWLAGNKDGAAPQCCGICEAADVQHPNGQAILQPARPCVLLGL